MLFPPPGARAQFGAGIFIAVARLCNVMRKAMKRLLRFLAKKERQMFEQRPVANQRIARMLRELEGDANPARGRATKAAKPATACGAHLKGRMARHGFWLLTRRVHIR